MAYGLQKPRIMKADRVRPLLLALLLGAGLLASEPVRGVPQLPPPGEPIFEAEVSVGWVLVPVVVRSGAGYVKGLDEEDFRLLVDGRRVDIESLERRADAPASIVFLQDLSGSMDTGGRLEASRRTVGYFLDNALTGDEFALATFAGEGGKLEVDVPFTKERTALREASAGWKPYGKTALHDAVSQIPKLSLTGNNPKRFALLVTDGVDNASAIPPDEAREIVRQAQLPVYVLGLDSGSPYALNTEGEKIYRYSDVLNLLAQTTGGRYFAISGPEDLEKALAAIKDDLRHQYVLGFSTGEGAERYRRLEVKIEGKHAVLFRHGYKGPPPAGG